MIKPSLRCLSVAALATVTGLTATACGPGGDDDGGACSGILPGELVITEIFGDAAAPPGGTGADEGKEWFEIYNASGAPIDLEGIAVVHARPDGASSHTVVLDSVTIAAGDYLVLGDVLPEFVEGHLDYGYGEDLGSFFNTNGGRLTLRCGDATIDEVLYDVIASGVSTGFDGGAPPDYTANDDLSLWCTPPEEAPFEFLPANFGTPGQVNFDCAGGGAGMCLDGDTLRATVPPTVGQLVITEVMPSPSTPQGDKEWFEVLATADVDLNGIQLDRAGDSSAASSVDAEACLRVTAGTYLVFASNIDPLLNGTLPRVDGVFGFTMVTDGDVRILDAAGGVIDAVTWTGATSAVSRQLDPDFSAADVNDMERYWCNATTAWAGADRGSPGVANEQCAILPPAGQCVDPDTLAERAIVSPTAGQVVITEWLPNPGGADGTKEWFELRATAAVDLNGLQAGTTTLGATPLVVSADCVEVTAGDYFLFGQTADPLTNGGLPTVDDIFGFTLPNNTGGATGTLRIGLAGVDLDVVTWTANVDSSSIQKDTDGTQCDASATVPQTAQYNGIDRGTPRAVHTAECP